MSNILRLIIFFSIAYGLFMILDISIIKIINYLINNYPSKKKSLKTTIHKYRNPEKEKLIIKIIKEAYTILEITNKKDNLSLMWIISLVLFAIGGTISIAINNFFLIPILSIGLGLTPFWYVIFSYNSFKRQVSEELETALSTITTSYIRSEDIILAVEENVDYLESPIKEVFLFFINQTRLITANKKLAIENMKNKIENDIFREWCSALIACQDNKNLKYTLVPIVSKLSDTRIITTELDTILYEPIKEFMSMLALVLANIPIIRIINKDWYDILVNSMAGKVVLTLMLFTIFISINAIVRLVRPVEYKS